MEPEDNQTDVVVPIAEETLRITKNTIETGRVRVTLTTETESAATEVDLTTEEVVVERHPIGRVVTEIPRVREIDGITVIPVVEEVLVKQLVLREEIHLRRVTRVNRSTQTQPLRRQVATVDRVPPR